MTPVQKLAAALVEFDSYDEQPDDRSIVSFWEGNCVTELNTSDDVIRLSDLRAIVAGEPKAGTIHAEIAERVALAQSYAEDGAFLSAARIYREIAAKLEERHRVTR